MSRIVLALLVTLAALCSVGIAGFTHVDTYVRHFFVFFLDLIYLIV